MSRRIARFAFLALGLIAVSALLFQPICEAAAPGGDDGDVCCSMAAPNALAAAPAPLTNGSSTTVAAPSVASPVFRPRILVPDALPAAAPPLVPRYYVRSARIQR